MQACVLCWPATAQRRRTRRLGEQRGGDNCTAVGCCRPDLPQGLLHQLLVPWRKAREWEEAELIAALPQGCCRAEVVEPLVQNWLSQRQESPPALLTLDGWPRVAARVQGGAVRVTVVEQKASIPVAVREALEDWVRQHGLLRDRVTLSLECVQSVAAPGPR
jgi:hypothetical protein